MCFVSYVLFLDKTVISFTGVDILLCIFKAERWQRPPKKVWQSRKNCKGGIYVENILFAPEAVAGPPPR